MGSLLLAAGLLFDLFFEVLLWDDDFCLLRSFDSELELESAGYDFFSCCFVFGVKE